jgi:molecular chaperone Hsp33
MSRDYAVIATAAGDTVRVIAARTTNVVREAQARHGCSPTVTAALGRLLTGAALIGVSLSGRERVTLQVNGTGPVRFLVVDAMPGGRVRGYPGRARAEVPLNAAGKFDVGGVVGSGSLHVTRIYDTGLPYTSAVPLQTGEIGNDLAYFFANSEQVPSVVAVGVLANPQGVLAAGGILAQLLPGADAATIEQLEIAARSLPQVSALVRSGMTPEEMVHHVARDLEPRIGLVQPLAFACPCDRTRVIRALVTLGVDQLVEMSNAEEDTEATCDFCGQRYYFSPDEIGDILDSASGESAL